VDLDWRAFAALSALFAALTAIIRIWKVGIGAALVSAGAMLMAL
jgi:hypothetical protein